MNVVLTVRQLEACRSIATPLHKTWLANTEPVNDAKSKRICSMPAIGWQQMLGLLEDFTVGPRQGDRRDAKRSALNARKRIARALVEMEAHPALRGMAIEAPSSQVLPVWSRTDPHAWDPVWSIYPNGGSFTLLWPNRVEFGVMNVTRWDPGLPVGESALLLESAHLAFVNSVPAEDDGEVVR
jgi:hypothetical protein